MKTFSQALKAPQVQALLLLLLAEKSSSLGGDLGISALGLLQGELLEPSDAAAAALKILS